MFTGKSAQYTDVKNQNISPLVGLDSLYYEQATYNSTPGAQANYVITREAVYKHMPIQLFNNNEVTPYEFDPSVNTAPENLQNTQKITAIPNQEKNILVLNQASTFLVAQTNIPLHGIEANRCTNLSDILYNYNSKYDISEYYNMFNSSITSAYLQINASLLDCSNRFNASIKKMDNSTRFEQVESDISSINEIVSDLKLNIDSQLDRYSTTVYSQHALKRVAMANKLEVNKTYTMKYDRYSNKFLISLLAINSSQFSPIVSTQKLEGDTYFSNSDVDKWEVKYDFENNVITYMKDEYGNEAPYDFKNIISPRTSYLFKSQTDTDYSLTGKCTNNTVNSTWHNISFVNTTSTQKNIQYNYIGFDSSNIVINDGHNNKVLNNTQNVTIYGNNNYIGNNNNDVIIKTDNNIIKNNNVSINIDISSGNNIIGNYNNKVELKVSSNTKIYNNCTSIYSNNSNNNTFFGYNSYIQIDNVSTQWPYSYTASGSTVKIADPIGENIFYVNVAGTTTNPIKLTNTNNIQIYSEIQVGKTYDYSDAYSFIFNGNVSSNLTNHTEYGIASHISNDILLAKDTDSTASYSAENNEWLVDRSTPTKFYITTVDSGNPITSNTGDVTIKPNTVGWNITNTYSTNKHYIHINPKNITQTVNVDLLYDNAALLPNNLYKDTTPSNIPPLSGWGADKSAFCYTFRSTQYPSDAYTLNTNNIWDGPYNMKQGINLSNLNIWGKSDKFPNVYISSNLFSRVQYEYSDPTFPILTVTSHGIVPFTDAVGNVTLKLYGNAVKDITKIVYSKSDDTIITANTVHEFTVGDSSLVKFKAESNPNVNSGLLYNTELTVSSSINNTDETLNITLSYNLIDRAGSHRYLGYSGNHNTYSTINEPNKLDNYPKLTFKTKNGKTIDTSVLLDIGTCYGEITFDVRFAFLPPNFTPDEQWGQAIMAYYAWPMYTFSHFEYGSDGKVTNFVFKATSFNTTQNHIESFDVVGKEATAFYNMGYHTPRNIDPNMPLHQDLTDINSLMNLYIPIEELTSVMCDEVNDQVYIHNYDDENNEIENPDSSNGILRLQYYIEYDNWDGEGEGPNINDYLMKVYYRTDLGDDLPLDYVLHFNCKQLYRRQFAPEVLQAVQPL